MASSTAIQRLKEDVMCSICLEPMTEPMGIDCGHIYCRSCIMRSLESQLLMLSCQGNFHCPVCRAEFRQGSIHPIKQLENVINTIKEMEKDHLCESHGEKLHLFCGDDEQLICWRCERSPQHKGHVTVLVEDAGEVHKEMFQKSLIELRKLEDKNKQWQMNITENIKSWKMKTVLKSITIQCGFEELHKFLHEEEQFCLQQLENTEKNTLQKLQDSEAKLKKQSQELSNHILELERKCQGPAQDLLQGVRDNYNRISALKLDEPEDVSLDLDIMHSVLGFFSKLRETFDDYRVFIHLDSDTAHKDLFVTREQKKVRWRYQKKKNYTPAKFRDLPCILGHQIFASGSHFFKVSRLEGPEWDVGVCLENVSRDNDTRDPESGFWAIRRCKEGHYEALTSPPTPLHIQKEFESLRVFLNNENGFVSFYDFRNSSHIFTFPKASFSGPLRAYFRIGERSTLYL